MAKKVKTKKALAAQDALRQWIREIGYEDFALTQDDWLIRCKYCGREAWIIDDIKHKRGCNIWKMTRNVEDV